MLSLGPNFSLQSKSWPKAEPYIHCIIHHHPPISSSPSLTPPSMSITSVPTFHTSQPCLESNLLHSSHAAKCCDLSPSPSATVSSSCLSSAASIILPSTSYPPPPPKSQRKASGPTVSKEAACEEFLKIQLNLQ